MKTYGSIGKEILLNEEVWIFDKPDGSNVRSFWEHKKGFTQFGSRTKTIDKSTPILGQAVDLIKEQEDRFNKLFTDNKFKSATCFFEFFGSSSQFGQHVENEPKQVQLFDIAVDKRGLVYPPKFMDLSQGFNITPLLYQGLITNEIIEQIKRHQFPGITLEGAVIKLNKGSPGLPHMFKVKTDKWLESLKFYCKDDADLFNKLA